MYQFILTQWIMRKINEDKVQSFVPRWITQKEADDILATSRVTV